ncbi:MAG: hypothetical protein ACI9QC_000540, partial [Oceanicoccus sp.]
LFVAFFFSLGLTILLSSILFMQERVNQSKTARFFQWFFFCTGLLMIVIGFGTLEFEPILTLLFSMPLMRLLSSRSLTDILSDKAGKKHPWMDQVSDLLFIVSLLTFLSILFVDQNALLLASSFITLGLSLCFDQINYGVNKKEWSNASLMIASALILFFTPGVVILISTLQQ